jgi:PhnB protein
MSHVHYIPQGSTAVTPYLVIDDCARALEFLAQVFGAQERFKMTDPAGLVAHAEVTIDGAVIELANSTPEWPATRTLLHVYVPNSDEVFERAVAAGCTVKKPMTDEFYGERTGTVVDPFGNMWSIATVKEALTHGEMLDRANRLFGGHS